VVGGRALQCAELHRVCGRGVLYHDHKRVIGPLHSITLCLATLYDACDVDVAGCHVSFSSEVGSCNLLLPHTDDIIVANICVT
jgi:hypothetical protein